MYYAIIDDRIFTYCPTYLLAQEYCSFYKEYKNAKNYSINYINSQLHPYSITYDSGSMLYFVSKMINIRIKNNPREIEQFDLDLNVYLCQYKAFKKAVDDFLKRQPEEKFVELKGSFYNLCLPISYGMDLSTYLYFNDNKFMKEYHEMLNI